MPDPLELSDRVRPGEDLSQARIDGEIALFSASRGAYFGLGSPGSRIFELLDGHRTIRDVCAILVGEFQVEERPCAEDVLAFLGDLERRRLLIRVA
jgi:hypothetical protein